MAMLNATVNAVTERIRSRSRSSRQEYLQRLQGARQHGLARTNLSCTNLAHAVAACPGAEKDALKGERAANIAIVSAYNDMLSAHQPYGGFPAVIKQAAQAAGGAAQFAGGVPAMCDGVTQGQPGMELSLFSRDVIALSTAVALSHNVFDGVLYLGVCDKIVPGLLIGAISFGHLPGIFVPAGPMPSGISNTEKSEARQRFAEGKIDVRDLLEVESQAYHAPGTCTFYGTANSNQMLMEVMGLHLPGASFVPPGTPLRDALTAEATRRVLALHAEGGPGLGEVVDERAIVNGVVGLLATGGSTNHCIHLVAIARAAGIALDWDDFAELSAAVPLLTRMYPNGKADVNEFHQAGGMAVLIGELLDAGLLHGDIHTVFGKGGLQDYVRAPALVDGMLHWEEHRGVSTDGQVLRGWQEPFAPTGGLRLLQGNLGRAVIKVSAVPESQWRIQAPARVFDSQAALLAAFERGELDRDTVAVVRFQGPRANGMPELHKLTPALSVLQARGHQVALITDGRMSGASGKVPAAIHVTPECARGGPLAKVRDGDLVIVDAVEGRLEACVEAEEWAEREPSTFDLGGYQHGLGRELFALFRRAAGDAEAGGSPLFGAGAHRELDTGAAVPDESWHELVRAIDA